MVVNGIFVKPGDITLDCQSCGEAVRILSEVEKSQVADNPYNFIVFCSDECREYEQMIQERNGF